MQRSVWRARDRFQSDRERQQRRFLIRAASSRIARMSMMGMEGMFGIIITLVSVGVTLVITAASLFFAWKVFSGFQQNMQQSAQLMQTGRPAQAQIVSVRDLGGSIQMGGQLPQQRLQIDLQVMGTNGQPYPVSVTQLVSMLHMARLAPGSLLEVRVDPANPMRVAVVL
jgi:hypothetical protein